MARGLAGDERVLVVDADRGTVESVTAALETLGYGARGAGSFDEALAAVREETPALVIVDVELPGRSGYELLQELREHLGEVPVIFISSERTEPLDRVAGLLAGGDDYLVKPVDPEALAARVRAVLRRAAGT
jgi:two-component system OmpR family response regulator